MASSTVAALTAASAVDADDLLYVVEDGADRKLTLGQLQTFFANVGWAAANVGISDAGTYFTASQVEGALQEIGAALAGLGGLVDVLTFRGVLDCSANPNYPAADAGAVYVVSVAGKIGGGSGANVEAGDTLICRVDATATGDHATVGSNWTIIQKNIDGGVIGPASSTDNTVPRFDSTTGKLIQGSGVVVTDDNEISGYRGNVNRQTGTSYTLDAADAGKVVELANAAAIALTLPNSLPKGWHCTVVQDAAGQVTFTAASGATLKNRQSHTKTAGDGALCVLYVSSNAGSAAAWRLGGDTAT
jgi:hypothetical protein